MATPAAFRMGEGDWICSDLQCANINFARRTHCNRCGNEKEEPIGKKKLGQEIGTAAAAKSHGLFSADDWQCVKCANVNWARRQQCNVCNAPRFGEIEERTGLGGGFNDRGVVEYKKREDSDDEYDEFGRRKKRQRTNSDRSSVNQGEDEKEETVKDDGEKEEGEAGTNGADKKEDHEEDEDEEEDDDDDDDDGDLSKYDLSDWIMDKKVKTDFSVKKAKNSMRWSGHNLVTYGFSLSLILIFVNKFVYSPFKKDKRYKQAEEYSNFLYEKEKKL